MTWMERSVEPLVERLRFPGRLSAPALIEAAVRRSGLSDFGPDDIEEPLARFVEACEGEADLSMFGRLSTRWDCLRLLINLLILTDAEREDPTILKRPVDQPLFVMGLPRSGTSFLHALLAEDPLNTAPRCWQTIYPVPHHPAQGRRSGPKQVERQFSIFRRLAPEVKKLHPFDAYSPQECTEITAHSFRSLRFDITYEIPSYRRWLKATGHAAAYRLHRRFLQHLQGDQPRRWVLKSPDHVFALDDLHRAYPDARVVFVHRDPLEVLPSVAKLTEVLRRPFTRTIDRETIGRQISGDWAWGAARIVAVDADRLWPTSQIHHVHYKDLIARPVETVQSLYGRFGQVLTGEARARMEQLVALKPDGGYGRNAYRFEDFGLDPKAERRRFGSYMSRFRVEGGSALVAA